MNLLTKHDYLQTENHLFLVIFWTQDSKYVLFINDTGGDENFNTYAVDPSAATATQAPKAKNLTPMEDVRAQIYMVSEKILTW